jgi:hypothetical protein
VRDSYDCTARLIFVVDAGVLGDSVLCGRQLGHGKVRFPELFPRAKSSNDGSANNICVGKVRMNNVRLFIFHHFVKGRV